MTTTDPTAHWTEDFMLVQKRYKRIYGINAVTQNKKQVVNSCIAEEFMGIMEIRG